MVSDSKLIKVFNHNVEEKYPLRIVTLTHQHSDRFMCQCILCSSVHLSFSFSSKKEKKNTPKDKGGSLAQQEETFLFVFIPGLS